MATASGSTLRAAAGGLLLAALALGGCGSSKKTVPSPATVGGPDQTVPVTITGPGGAEVTVPPGAAPEPVVISIGAAPASTPPPPVGFTAVGAAFEITPHGATFAQPVTVRLPIDPGSVPADAQLAMLKAEPGGPWVAHVGGRRVENALELEVDDFSTFAPAALPASVGTATAPLALLVSPVEAGRFGPDPERPGMLLDPTDFDRPSPLPLSLTVSRPPPAGCSLELVGQDLAILRGLRFFLSGPLAVPPAGTPWVARSGATIWKRAAWARYGQPGSPPMGGLAISARLVCPQLLVRPDRALHVQARFAPNRVGFVREPEDAVAAPGDRAAFSAIAAGGTADPTIPLDLVWLRSDDQGTTWAPVAVADPVPENEDGIYADDELDWYRTPPVAATDDGALFRLRACATGPDLGGAPQHDCAYSAVARLSVSSSAQAPAIASQPQSLTVAEGSPATFAVVATGTAPLAYQWQRDGVDLPGATEATLTLAAVVAGAYRVVVTNPAGAAVSADAWLSVTPAPTVTAFTPGAGATWVPVDASITVDFSHAMNATSLMGGGLVLEGLQGAVAGTMAVAGRRVTFTPSAPLCNPCAFTVTATTAARSLDGVPLAAPVTVSFSTGLAPTQAPSRIAAAGVHTLVVHADDSVFTWGTNVAGALGSTVADMALAPHPRRAVGPPPIRSVDGAAYYSLALAVDGTVWGWGWGPNLGVADSRFQPAPIAWLTGVVALSAGYRHALALHSDGGVSGWGYEDADLLTPVIGSNAPRRLDGLSGIAAVAAGEGFSLALRSDGVVLAWGAGSHGELGDGLLTARAAPAPVPGLTGVVAIAAQSFTGMALREDGTVWAWGRNAYGEAGTGSLDPIQLAPAQVLAGAIAIAAGNYHGLALMSGGTGRVRTWGYNADGRLGDGSLVNQASPVDVFEMGEVVEVSGGEFHSALRTLTTVLTPPPGHVYTMGSNSSGQLGDGTSAAESEFPVGVPGFDPETVPPRIQTQPLPLTVAAGAPASFSVVATGADPHFYYWLHDGTAFSGSVQGGTITIASATPADAGVYTVVVSNAGGDETSVDAILTVTP